MKKYIVALLTISVLNFAFMHYYLTANNSKIAVVNISKIVEKSEKVKELRDNNNKKLDELEKWIEESRVKIQKEKDKTKKEQLIDQYQDIARQKEDIIKQNYNAKLQEIDNEIAETIKNAAKKNKCDTILLSSAVMQGGLDITNEVINELR